ncbi:mycocerosic acid synthase protein [Colletotrichum incanum]|uniref:Mycocerosic acid synthase protein n=1 Tax=Colletotrichum incanum TaxID=1573173 RepID=A0A167D4N3_COLIC|nr:mycocerosic acid synthase protein [Colletotrichum incanum]
MLDANDEPLLESPVFGQLVCAQEKQATSAARADKVDCEKALLGVKSMERAEQLIRDATLTKFAVFLDRLIDESGSTSRCPLSASTLVTIELNIECITALTLTIASRFKLIPDEIRRPNLQRAEELPSQTAHTPKNDQVEDNGHGSYCCRTAKELPRQPLVDLDEAVKDLLNKYSALSRKTHDLAAPGGLGRKLYSQLRAKADNPSFESWIAGPLLKAFHIKRRYSLAPFSNFLGTPF